MDQAVVITTINPPTRAVLTIATQISDWQLLVVGDRKTQADWAADNTVFLSVDAQTKAFPDFAKHLPENHYARKNIGYLHALHAGAKVIAETDDDNIPYEDFLTSVDRDVRAERLTGTGWVNIYREFVDTRGTQPIWPRGLPLDVINQGQEEEGRRERGEWDCAVLQFLADGDPDVDAFYRLTTTHDTHFRRGRMVLGSGAFCPFNSQNTVWYPETFPLLYLPSHVSFRMTDIWRSLIAQACIYAAGSHVAFCEPTVWQDRNPHDLMRDFNDEVVGYQNNRAIMTALNDLNLEPGWDAVPANLRRCYTTMIEHGWMTPRELTLLDAWLAALPDR